LSDKTVIKGDEVTLEIKPGTDILEVNKKLAKKNNQLLRENKVQSIDIMGSIGAGKTSLIEKIVQKLKKKYKIAVFKGDLTTTETKAELSCSNPKLWDLLNKGELEGYYLGSQLKLELPDLTEPLEIDCTVVWNNVKKDKPVGMGLKFSTMEERERKVLQSYLESIK